MNNHLESALCYYERTRKNEQKTRTYEMGQQNDNPGAWHSRRNACVFFDCFSRSMFGVYVGSYKKAENVRRVSTVYNSL